MTLDCRDIETLLGPLRRPPACDIWLPHESRRTSPEWAEIPFSETWETLREVLGDPEKAEDRETALVCMGIQPMIGFLHEVPPLAAGPSWNLFDHQTAGLACRHAKLVGHAVSLKPAVHSACLEIARDWFGSSLGRALDEPTLDDLDSYRAQIKAIGLDCNYADTYSSLQEGLYPAEITQDIADAIFANSIDLAGLLANPDHRFKLRHMKFFVIAANSD